MSGPLSLVPEPGGDEAAPVGRLDLALVADRVGWEEKAILTAARERGARAEWLDDGELCCGSREDLPAAGAYLIRSRSFVRGPLIAESIAEGPDDPSTINSAATIELCSNKVTALARLRQAGLPTVPYRLVLTRADLAAALELVGLPLVLKPVYGGLGRRVLLVRERAVADSVYDYVEHYAQNFDRALIAQPFLDGASDVRVLAIDGEAVAAMERVAGDDWRANVELGASAEAIELDDEIRAVTAAVGERIGARIFGLDLFRHDGALLVGEVNHSPLFRGIVDATGIDVAGRIAEHALGVAVR
ncbi:MAG TPA: RimK family alpha-L-glutamate ligase [Thermoleophilaceae bacterium]|nr:RimK family alpha-L-glutamate ligase [Thermoleophilaceae bacterium]